MDRFKVPEFRAALYGVFAALALVASVYGLLNDEQVTVILGVISAGIGLLANLNTPTAKRVAAKEQE